MLAKIPGIPAILSTIPKEIRSVLEPMKEILALFTDPMNPAVRMSQLVGAGLIGGYDGEIIAGPGTEIDTSPPPAPTGLTASGALATIILAWDDTEYNNIAHTEIWRAQTNDFSVAQKVGTAPGRVYADPVGGAATRFYWIRYISRADIAGPFNAQGGTQGTTGYDAGYLLDVLAANPPGGATYDPLLYVQAEDIVIDGVTIPAGLYSNMGYFRKLSITYGMIAKLAVDDGNIVNLNAVKINAGDINADRMSANIVEAVQGKFASLSAITANLGTVEIGAGGYLRTAGVGSYVTGTGFWMGQHSGTYKMRIGNPAGQNLTWDGTNLSLTGALNAATGTFSGDISAASGNFRGAVTGGAITGWSWPAAGAGNGFYLGANGLLLGNANGGKYLFANLTGSISTNMTLSGADGTFSGTLTASAVNAVNTINLAGQAVTIPISANGGAVTTAVGVGSDVQLAAVSASINSTGAPIFITWAVDDNSYNFSLVSGTRLYRNGGLLTGYSSKAGCFKDTPGAGTHTYRVDAFLSNASDAGTLSIATSTIMMLEAKR